MFKKLILITTSIIFACGALADTLSLKKDAPTTYVVKKGDTLWDISGVFLNQPWLWPKLWRLNPDINNPHLIYPGDELRLVYDEKGEPVLVKTETKPEYKWSPKAQATLKDLNPVTTIPLHVVAPYLKYDSILSEEQLARSPYVLGSDEGYKSSLDGFKVYVKGALPDSHDYAIYQKGDKLIDPDTEEFLGYRAILVGSGKLVGLGNDAEKVPSTLYVDNAIREIRSGDIVLPINETQYFPSYFTMKAVADDFNGKIIMATSEAREFGKLEVVILNRGLADNLGEGDVLTVKRTSPGVLDTRHGPVYTKEASVFERLFSDDSDYKMPAESIGQMMVFKVYQDISLALVMNSTKPLRVKDSVSAP